MKNPIILIPYLIVTFFLIPQKKYLDKLMKLFIQILNGILLDLLEVVDLQLLQEFHLNPIHFSWAQPVEEYGKQQMRV